MPPAGHITLHDRFELDSVDYSDLCRGWSVESENGQIEASGMSISGNDEFLDGARAQAVNVTLKYTAALNTALWPIHSTRDVVPFELQPNGLTAATGAIWYGNVSLPSYPPEATRGDLAIVTIRLTPADEDGISQWAAS